MKTIYKVAGMTCGNCKKSVEDSLLSVEKISSVAVSLENGTVEVESPTKLAIEELRAILPSKYTISDVVERTKVYAQKEPFAAC